MATQAEVVSFIKSNLKYDQVDETTFKLLYGTSGDRSQLVWVFVWDTTISVLSGFAHTNKVSAERALEVCSTSSIFGMQKMGDMYCLKHVIPLSDVDASELHFGFEWVANGADELEKQLSLNDSF